MKKVFYLLLLLLIVTACGKKMDNVTPDAGARIAGTYAISRFAVLDTTTGDVDVALPRSGTTGGTTVTETGQILVTRLTETTATLMIIIKTTGQPDSTIDFGTVDIAGNELYQNNEQVGTADGTSINIDATDQDVRLIVDARK